VGLFGETMPAVGGVVEGDALAGGVFVVPVSVIAMGFRLDSVVVFAK